MTVINAQKLKQRRDARRKTMKMQLDWTREDLTHERTQRQNEKAFYDKMIAEEQAMTKVYRDRFEDMKHVNNEKIRRLKRDVKIFAVAGPLYGIGIFLIGQYLVSGWIG